MFGPLRDRRSSYRESLQGQDEEDFLRKNGWEAGETPSSEAVFLPSRTAEATTVAARTKLAHARHRRDGARPDTEVLLENNVVASP